MNVRYEKKCLTDNEEKWHRINSQRENFDELTKKIVLTSQKREHSKDLLFRRGRISTTNRKSAFTCYSSRSRLLPMK